MSVAKFNLQHIKKRRNKIAAFLSSHYVGRPIVGEAIADIANHIVSVLPKTVSPSAVFETVRLIAGRTLSSTDVLEFAWRIAGNVDQLIAGEHIVEWTRQVSDEVVPVRVETVTPTSRRNEFGFNLRCRVQAGSSCPIAFTQFFSARSCKAISRVIGFSSTSWGPYQYGGVAAHFVNMLFFAHIEAARSRDQPWFRHVSVASGMLKANKALLDVRCRVKPCPVGYTHSCAECIVGYADCSYATHKLTYVEQLCSVCGKTALFDPAAAAGSCISCQKRFSLSNT